MLDIMQTIIDAQLCVPPDMTKATLEDLCAICNGIGAEWIPMSARKKITKAFNAAEASAAIHDWLYEHSDGSRKSQERADKCFRANALTEIDWKYCWYNPIRYISQRKILVAYDALRAFGRIAWLEAFVKKLNLES